MPPSKGGPKKIRGKAFKPKVILKDGDVSNALLDIAVDEASASNVFWGIGDSKRERSDVV